MGDLILGPAWVLPPGEWAVGARVDQPHARTDGRMSGVLIRPASADWYDVAGPVLSPGERRVHRRGLRLDLTTGPLDYGTRALLALVATGVEQPLTAPGWVREDWTGATRSKNFAGWVLHGGPNDWDPYWMIAELEDHGIDLVVPCICDEPDPRRALALALEAAWALGGGGGDDAYALTPDR